MLNLSELTDKVRALAIEAGDFIREERKKFHREAIEKKHAHDYVSYVDKESEKKIVTRLKELLPEAGFIAEEGSGTLNDEQYCWLVDPLDGTTNFIHDNAPYCVSIALRSKKELLLGVVYEICRNECFWTYKGAPSYLNGNEIHVSAISNLDDSFAEKRPYFRASSLCSIKYPSAKQNAVKWKFGKNKEGVARCYSFFSSVSSSSAIASVSACQRSIAAAFRS